MKGDKMISNFNEEAQEILTKAKLEMLELKHPYVGTEHLVLAILHSKNELTERLSNYNLTYQKFKKEIFLWLQTLVYRYVRASAEFIQYYKNFIWPDGSVG